MPIPILLKPIIIQVSTLFAEQNEAYTPNGMEIVLLHYKCLQLALSTMDCRARNNRTPSRMQLQPLVRVLNLKLRHLSPAQL
jgi:hypothetical protein